MRFPSPIFNHNSIESNRTRYFFFESMKVYNLRVPMLETTMTLPLTLTEDGTIRITGTRVSLESVVYEYGQGATPEEIAVSFPSLRIEDVYATLTYYLNNREQVEEYQRQQEVDAEEVRRRIESPPDYHRKMQELRALIQERQTSKEDSMEPASAD